MILSKTPEIDISLVEEKEIPLLINSISKNLDKKNYDKKYWYWQYKQHPKKQSFLYAAWQNKQIVGYYHIVPYTFVANGKKYLIGNVQDVAVNKEFQGRGIFRKLSEFANSDVNKYVDILYSFPNKKSIRTFLKYDKFNLIDCIPIYVLPLKFLYRDPKIKLDSNNKVVFFDQLDNEIYGVFEKFSKLHNFYVLRDKDFLNWRYINSPKGKFFFVGLMRNNKISAIIVVKHEKIYKNETYIILDFAFTDNIEDFNKLISNFYFSLNESYSLNANFVIISGLSHCISQIKKFGYIKIPKFFIPRQLNLVARLTKRSLKVDSFNSSDWLVTLGDWDIF